MYKKFCVVIAAFMMLISTFSVARASAATVESHTVESTVESQCRNLIDNLYVMTINRPPFEFTKSVAGGEITGAVKLLCNYQIPPETIQMEVSGGACKGFFRTLISCKSTVVFDTASPVFDDFDDINNNEDINE